MTEQINPTVSALPSDHQAALEAIGQALESLRFGTIVLTVHDSKVVQLEVTEKKRFDR